MKYKIERLINCLYRQRKLMSLKQPSMKRFSYLFMGRFSTKIDKEKERKKEKHFLDNFFSNSIAKKKKNLQAT